MDIERSILTIIRGGEKSPSSQGVPCSLESILPTLIALKNFAYHYRLLPSTKLPVPVISVGNIAVGGTGKTPLVHLLALQLQERIQLAILSRGYRSQLEKSKSCKKISSISGPLYQPAECGDEPYFLSQKTKAAIWVGANRTVSGLQAIAEGAQCLLLDDGMQHRTLKARYRDCSC